MATVTRENVTTESSWFPSAKTWDTTIWITSGNPENDQMNQLEETLNFASKFVYSFCAVFTLSNNMLTILALANFPDLQKRTNAFILNLTIADLLNFFALVNLLLIDTAPNELANRILSCLTIFLHILSKFLSLLTLLLIALDRYSAVVQPIKHRWKTTKHGVRVIALCWLIAFSVPSLAVYYMVKDSMFDHIMIGYILPTWLFILVVHIPIWFIVLSCVFLYCRVIREVRKRLLKVVELHATNQLVDGRAAKVIADNKRIIQMMAIILLTAIITWIPYSIFCTFVDYQMYSTEPSAMITFKVISWFIHFNGFINPLIYAWSSSAFKHAYLKLLWCRRK